MEELLRDGSAECGVGPFSSGMRSTVVGCRVLS